MAKDPSGDTVFSCLPADLSAELFGKGRPATLAADEVLFLAGDPGDGCYRVDSGLLKASVVSASGAERILGIFGPGSIFGELSMIDGEPRSASMIAIRESKVVFVSRASFDALALARPEICRRIMVLLTRRLRDVDNSLLATSFLSLKGRTARILLGLADAFGEHVGSGRVVVRQNCPARRKSRSRARFLSGWTPLKSYGQHSRLASANLIAEKGNRSTYPRLRGHCRLRSLGSTSDLPYRASYDLLLRPHRH